MCLLPLTAMPVPAPLKKPIVPSHRMTESPLRDGKGSKATSQRLSNDAADAHIKVQLLSLLLLNSLMSSHVKPVCHKHHGCQALAARSGAGAHMTRSWGMRPTFSHWAAGSVSCTGEDGSWVGWVEVKGRLGD